MSNSKSPTTDKPEHKVTVVHEVAHLPAQPNTALITGVNGQDGSYLAEFLLGKGYKVHGLVRRASSFNTERIDHLYRDPNFQLHYGDLTDGTALMSVIATVRPSEIYNLAAQSHVQVSFDMPEYTAECDGVGVLKLLDAIRACGLTKHTRFYQASTSELYGSTLQTLIEERRKSGKTGEPIMLSESTPFHPRSPYAVAKMFAYWIVVNYRESYGMFASNGILFNHESPRRGPTFVTRKIARGAALIARQKEDCLFLGNLNALRDWGHARDYVEGMWMMLQADAPRDYVLAMGEQYSVRQFAELCFERVGLPIKWKGEGISEVGYVAAEPDRIVVRVDEKYFRPAEVENLLGDATKARKELGWVPRTPFKTLVDEMVDSELQLVDASGGKVQHNPQEA